MLECRSTETSGPCGFAPINREKHKSPIDKICDSIRERRNMEKALKELDEIEVIKNKPQHERSLEEKIKLANYYAKVVVGNAPSVEPKYIA